MIRNLLPLELAICLLHPTDLVHFIYLFVPK